MFDAPTAGFLRVLDPTDNATGGGTASAIAGGMAAALAAMVARLSLSLSGPEPRSYYEEIAREGAELSRALLAGGDEDALAFDDVVKAYRLPKGTDEEVSARRAAIRAAIEHATRVPLANAERCERAAVLVKQLEGRSNTNAASDLLSAGFLARAGLLGCLANVDINLPSIKDPVVAEEIRARAGALRPS